MEREVPEPKSTEEIRQEALTGLQNLRQHLIEANADMEHRPNDPDPVQRAECNLAFVLHAVSPIVLEYFYTRWTNLNFGSRIQRLAGESLQYVVAIPEWKPEGKVVIPARSSADIIYGSMTHGAVELDNHFLEDRWGKGLNRSAITRFGDLSREQILQKFEKAIK